MFAQATPGVAFDCSGLTMWAWAQVGVRMPHFAASQYQMFPKVALDSLQPGDLVFFYNDFHHVGLYIGGGMIIDSPTAARRFVSSPSTVARSSAPPAQAER